MKFKKIFLGLGLALGLTAFFVTLILAQSPAGGFTACTKHAQVVGQCVCSAAEGPVQAARASRKLPKLDWPTTGYAWIVLGGYTPCNPGVVSPPPAQAPAAQPTTARSPTRAPTLRPTATRPSAGFVTATPVPDDVLVVLETPAPSGSPTPFPGPSARLGEFLGNAGNTFSGIAGFIGSFWWILGLIAAVAIIYFWVLPKIKKIAPKAKKKP